VFQFCFVSLAVTSGLFYLAELVEEFVSTAAKIIKTLIMITIGIHVGFLLFEDFPLRDDPFWCFCRCQNCAFSIWLGSIAVTPSLRIFTTNETFFEQVMAYFTLCLWLVPFAFFVSLSANDLVLPTTSQMDKPKESEVNNDAFSNYIKTKGKRLGLLAFFNGAKDVLLPQRNKKVF
ncbi:hypothetical protein Ocin01_13991, partial [Orchesella cincta]